MVLPRFLVGGCFTEIGSHQSVRKVDEISPGVFQGPGQEREKEIKEKWQKRERARTFRVDRKLETRGFSFSARAEG